MEGIRKLEYSKFFHKYRQQEYFFALVKLHSDLHLGRHNEKSHP